MMPELQVQTGTTEQPIHHAELQALRRELGELSRRMSLVESAISKLTTPSLIMQTSGSSKNHSGLPEYDRSLSGSSSSADTTRTYGSPSGQDNDYQEPGLRVHGEDMIPLSSLKL